MGQEFLDLEIHLEGSRAAQCHTSNSVVAYPLHSFASSPPHVPYRVWKLGWTVECHHLFSDIVCCEQSTLVTIAHTSLQCDACYQQPMSSAKPKATLGFAEPGQALSSGQPVGQPPDHHHYCRIAFQFTQPPQP